MGSLSLPNSLATTRAHGVSSVNQSLFPSLTPSFHPQCRVVVLSHLSKPRGSGSSNSRAVVSALAGSGVNNTVPTRNRTYTVGDFMTRKENLHAVKPTTSIDEALELLVEKKVTGLPVIDDNWNLVGVVSDYDLLSLDSIPGGGGSESNMFPNVDSSWRTFKELQKLISKTYGEVVGDLMTTSPLVVRENTNLEDAARLLLETKYRRLPVVEADGKLVGILTRGNVVRAALQIKGEKQKLR